MQVYNTLTRRKEEFVPREKNKVSIYVCGPTTYNYIHLGNARPLVFFDTVRRYFIYKGYDVHYIQNFTDIDDKIINRAKEENEDPLALSSRFVEEYYKDADALNVKRADVHPKVSEHLKEIIDMISTLIEKGYAYVIHGNVYYDVSKFEGYGKLSGRSLDDMQAGARVEVDGRKIDPMDFALWKAAKPGEPAWESPWGKGRPGWHIECSAMSLKYLGSEFDIHGGGYDLIFPHHENEIAQSEAATDRPFARYWMHNGFITVKEEKMSKSLGNFFLVREVLDKFPPELVRFYLLSTHYRNPLDFDHEKLDSCSRGLERIKTSIRLLYEAMDKGPSIEGENSIDPRLNHLKEAFDSAMSDDFNTALAISVLFDLAKEVNSCLRESNYTLSELERAKELFHSFNGVLGIFKEDAAGKLQLGKGATRDDLSDKLIQLVLEIRQDARKNKDFATADKIRDSLKDMGIIVEDTPEGPRWILQE